MRITYIIPLLLGVFTACQGAGPNGMPRGCPNWPNDSGDVYPLHRVEPRYRGREAACVDIDAEIDRTGAVTSAKVVKSTSPGGGFDAAALRAYRRWRYCPLQEGAPDYPKPTTVRLCYRPG